MSEPRPLQDDLRSIKHAGLSPAPDLESLLPRLLATVRCVSDELRPQARLAATRGLGHSLERDYGLDSLARVELIARVDRDLGVALGEAALTEAETPRDLLRFITRTGGPAADTASPVEPRDTQHPLVADAAPESYPPDAVQTLVEVFEWHLQRHPDRVLITLYENGDQPVDLRYADLHRDALALAAGLRALGLDRGDKVAIMLPTGREKDIIIRGGLNIHPQELETAVADIAGIRKGGVAVFAASEPRSGTERLVVLAETKVTEPEQRRQLIQAITALSATLLGAPADDVVLAPPRSVLKTSSGKTRRAACRELYEQGRLGVTQRAPWRQWAALAATAAAARARRAWRSGGRLAWGLWAWAVFCTLAAVAWCAVLVVPGVARRRRAARGARADASGDPPDRLARADGRAGPFAPGPAAHCGGQPRQLCRFHPAGRGAAGRVLLRRQARAGRRAADRAGAAAAGHRFRRALRCDARDRGHARVPANRWCSSPKARCGAPAACSPSSSVPS